MKKIIFAISAMLASALIATPAMAEDFTGFRLEATTGVDDVTGIRERGEDVSYGVAAGYDAPLGDKFIVGVEANVDNAFDYRDIGASARVGYKVTDSVLVYGKAGYTDFRGLEGVRLGGGVEAVVTGRVYVKAEYLYSDLERNAGRNQGLIGVGVRF